MKLEETFSWEVDKLAEAKRPDTSENFARVAAEIDAVIAPLAAERAIKWRGRILPGPLRVGFYLSTQGILAHTDNLLTLLSGLEKANWPICCFIFVGGQEQNPVFAEKFKRFNTIYTDPAAHPIDNWAEIQRFAWDFHLDAFVHVSHTQGLTYAAGIRCARKHIHWQMKWGGTFTGVDAVIDGNNPFHAGVGDASPFSCYTALPDMTPTADQVETAKIVRKRYNVRTVYGAFARDEKFSPEFIGAVKRILAANMDSTFLYASRNPIEGMPGKHIGWIDIRQGVRVVDVLLDTFPFPGGHVTWEAIAAQKPIIFMRVPPGPQHFAAELMEKYGSIPVISCDADEYVGHALGAARQNLTGLTMNYFAFYSNFMRNEHRMAENFVAAVTKVCA